MARSPSNRVYASTQATIDNLSYANLDYHVQIVLAFARDYDNEGKYTMGEFFAYFDDDTLNKEAIQAVKRRATTSSVKFFLSIGGRDPRFPFAVTSAEESDHWIKNATKSLGQLVTKYEIDGIDVYYEHIKSDAEDQFAGALLKVIESLKTNKTITDASITVSAPLLGNYVNLYTRNARVFDYVVYQTHSEPDPIANVDHLINVFFDKLKRYPRDRLLAGHSEFNGDWATVPPEVFLGAVPKLLDAKVHGISKWIASPNGYDPEG